MVNIIATMNAYAPTAPQSQIIKCFLISPPSLRKLAVPSADGRVLQEIG
jgi:hypothetical protein